MGVFMNNNKLVALTFDDGPSNITNQVLDILESNKIVGSFFLIGNLITEDKKPILERQLALGCEICNHSFTHGDMSKMSAEVIREEIKKTSDIIREMVNVETKFFRPPFILLSDTMYDNIDMPFICGEDSVDWNQDTTTEGRIENVLNKVHDGSIVLMHDMYNNHKTLEALPVIIEKLRAQGYEFVTISQLFEQKGINPNVKNKLWSNVFE